MQTLDDMRVRAGRVLRTNPDQEYLARVLMAVYNEGAREEREEIAVHIDKEATKSASLRFKEVSGTGLAVQSGKRLVAERLAAEVRARSQQLSAGLVSTEHAFAERTVELFERQYDSREDALVAEQRWQEARQEMAKGA